MKRYDMGRVIPFRAPRSTRLKLPFATSPDLRSAQISVLPEFESSQAFRRECWPELASYRPSTLIGYGIDLRRLAESADRDGLDLSSVDQTIFALTDCGMAPISEVLRATLWQSFGVPVYEVIVAPGCRLLAFECEAHDGWHVAVDPIPRVINGELICDFPSVANLHTGFSGQIDPEPCACGRGSVRLKNLAPHIRRACEQPVLAVA